MAAIDELESLSNSIPNLNNTAAAQQQAAQRIQARAGVAQAAQANPAASATDLSQTIAAPLAAQQGQTQVAAQTQTAQQGLQLTGQQAAQEQTQRQLGLQQQETQNQQTMFNASQTAATGLAAQQLTVQRDLTQREVGQQQALAKYGIDQDNNILQLTVDMRRTLRNMGNGLEDELFDSRRRFDNDQAGRKFSNERQMADYAAVSSQNQQDYDAKLNSIQAAGKEKELVLQGVRDKILTTLSDTAAMQQAGLNAAQQIELRQKAVEMDRAVQRQKATNGSIAAMIQGVFTVGGAIAGSMLPGAGTAAGAMIGSGLGQVAGSAVANQSPQQ